MNAKGTVHKFGDNVKVLFDQAGLKECHMRIACPPLVYGCPFINFTSSKSDMELITRRIIEKFEGDANKNLEKYFAGKIKETHIVIDPMFKDCEFRRPQRWQMDCIVWQISVCLIGIIPVTIPFTML